MTQKVHVCEFPLHVGFECWLSYRNSSSLCANLFKNLSTARDVVLQQLEAMNLPYIIVTMLQRFLYLPSQNFFQINGYNILSITADNPRKFALKALDIAFSLEELGHSTYKFMLRPKNPSRPTLDPQRVEMIESKG